MEYVLALGRFRNIGNRGDGGNGITQRNEETEKKTLRFAAALCESVVSVTSVAVTSVPSVAETVSAVAKGDQDAFSRLYADYVRLVHAILLGRVPRRDVDDLVQEVFIAAYTRLGELRDPAAFGGWIATIARNRATDHLRRAREQVELPDELPGGDAIEAETIAVLDIVRKLPEAYRETLLMRLVEGMSGAEIAERSGLTPASVRVNLHRGMKLLREQMGWRHE
jgi:RNA polymerase sigma-70 factor (ECF subfamily)